MDNQYDNNFICSLKEMITRAGSQKKYAEQIGISQSRISEYLNGKITLEGISFGILLRLFPDMKVSFIGNTNIDTEKSDLRPMEEELLSMFRNLTTKEQARCLLIIGAYFSDSIKK